MRVLIAIPTFENITPDTFKAIWDLDKLGLECDFEFVRGYDCATARNRIAQKAIDGGYDYVLMVDNDVTPRPDALKSLISRNVQVVSGYYLHRNDDNEPSDRTCVCRLRDEDGKLYFNYPLESEYTVEELNGFNSIVRIHGGGMGCILINVDVFREIPYPWFDWVNYADGNRGMLSEDLFFCERLKNAGIPMYVDPKAHCGHLFRKIVDAV